MLATLPPRERQIVDILYQQGPSIRYREAYARLTGATLPPGTPLPPLPDALQEDAGELDELLQQVDEVSLQLSAT